jgi:hypothetical protein
MIGYKKAKFRSVQSDIAQVLEWVEEGKGWRCSLQWSDPGAWNQDQLCGWNNGIGEA